MTDTYLYDAFGASRGGSGSSDQSFRFTGEQQDQEGTNELYYLRARYYDPKLGRFWTKDPFPLGNLYSYVGNNPISYVDPYGLCRFCDWVSDRAQNVGDAIWDGFDGPYDIVTIIQLADLFPTAEACGLGGLVGGVVFGPGALVVGRAAYSACDRYVESAIGVAAGIATGYQILTSGCPWQRQVAAGFVAAQSVAVDFRFNLWPGVDEAADVGFYTTGNELLDCPPTAPRIRGEK